MVDFETARIDAYFSHLLSRFRPSPELAAVVVAHMVPNTVMFIPALSRLIPVSLVLPKPKSEDRPEAGQLKQRLPGVAFEPLSRTWASDPDAIITTLRRHGLDDRELIIVDIGGYFAQSIDLVEDNIPGTIVGIMEGTENGVQKYERAMPVRVPVITVARSPLKLPEDFLVGSSIVFSIEAVLREQAQILQTRSACVIGFGRVGRAVAAVLRGRGISTVVHDTDPVAMAEAAAQGYQVYRRLDSALAHSSLVVSATGQRALDKYGLASIRNGTVVASVTSADDEFSLEDLRLGYEASTISDHLVRYDERGAYRYFWMINGGNAANFIHGAVIGPAIQLIEGEKMAAVSALASGTVETGALTPSEVSGADRRIVAEVWNEHFLSD